MKKILSVGLFILAIGSAQARLWPFSSYMRRVFESRGHYGPKVYQLVTREPLGNVSPGKAVRVLKNHLREMTPKLAQEVKDIMKAIDSGRAVSADRFEALSTRLRIERISRKSVEEGFLSGASEKGKKAIFRDTKAFLGLLDKGGRDEWIVKLIEEGEVGLLSERRALKLAQKEGYKGIREFFEAEQLPQDEYIYFSVGIKDKRRTFVLTSAEGYRLFNRLVEEKGAGEASTASSSGGDDGAVAAIIATSVVSSPSP